MSRAMHSWGLRSPRFFTSPRRASLLLLALIASTLDDALLAAKLLEHAAAASLTRASVEIESSGQ